MKPHKMIAADNILHDILVSRRLLSEHVDVLQLAKENNSTNGKWPRNAVEPPTVRSLARSALYAVVSVGALATCVRRVFNVEGIRTWTVGASLASTACTFHTFRRLRQQLQHHTQLRQVRQLIATVDAFDAHLRQRIKYLRESRCLLGVGSHNDSASNTTTTIGNQQQQRRARRLAAEISGTVDAAMPVIWTLYAAIQRLEMLPLTDEYADVYMPTESLEPIGLFGRRRVDDTSEPDPMFGVEHVRELHETFQFLQSQLLVRLGLACVFNTNEAGAFLGDDVPRLCKAVAVQLRRFEAQQAEQAQRAEVQRRIETRRAGLNQQSSADAGALTGLRHASLDVLARMQAVTDGMRNVDEVLHAATATRDESLVGIGTDVDRLGERLELCRDEYQRMLCMYHRAVHGSQMEPNSGIVDATATSTATIGKADTDDPNVRVFDDNDATAKIPEAEFYALVVDDIEDTTATNTGRDTDSELLELDTRIVKRQFRPVLRQLRNRLEPINDAMRQRERKFFAANGIDVDEDDNAAGQIRKEDGDADDIDDGDDDDAKPVAARKDQYADMRKFLQDKQPMSCFNPMLAPFPVHHRALDEDILE